MQRFQIIFFGVSGSCPSSTRNRQRYGSNTSCALVIAGDHFIILDMGTGLAQLSNKAEQYGIDSADILLSHFHYDHIEGFAFFQPFYSEAPFTIHAETRGDLGLEQLLFDYMRPPYFPITPKALSRNLRYHCFEEGEAFYLDDRIYVQTMHVNHPDSSTAYRINFDGRSLVYLLDHEHHPDYDKKVATFCKESDLVVYDAFFTNEEYRGGKYMGWGHSTPEKGIELAKNAGIKTLVLSHHALRRTDDDLERIGAASRTQFCNTLIAAEGMVIEV